MTQSKVDTVTIDLGGYTMESNGSVISTSNLDNITTTIAAFQLVQLNK